MGMFDYRDYSSSESSQLVSLSHQLAVYSSLNGAMGLPSGALIQGFGDLISGGFYPNPVQTSLPEGWRELKPVELGLPETAVDFAGHYIIASPLTGTTATGPQAKLLGQFDAEGKLTSISVSFAGTNSPVDVVDYLQLNSGEIAPNLEPLLQAVKQLAQTNGLTGKDVIVTGYSLGGAMTNIMAKYSHTLTDGFFDDAVYIGHASPVIYDHASILNMGYENDVVYRAAGDHNTFVDAINGAKPLLVNADGQFGASMDNIVLFNDVYASPLWPMPVFSILNIVGGWYGHIDGTLTNATDRISQSAFYEHTQRDSTVIVSNLSALAREHTWVSDKQTVTSDHYGTPAFIIGTQYKDLLQGGQGGDYLDGGAGDDVIRTGSGADRIDGGSGINTLQLTGNRADWDVYRLNDGTLFFNDRHGVGLKQAEHIQKVSFDGDWLSGERPYEVESSGLSDGRHQWLTWLNQDIHYQNATEGSAGQDQLSGQVVFGRAGDDVLRAQVSGSLLHGGEGQDVLIGGAGNDTLYGAEGHDVLVAGAGTNVLSGGVGHDSFVFGAHSGIGISTVLDFNHYSGDQDRLQFDHSLFVDAHALAQASRQEGKDVHISYGTSHIVVKDADLLAVLAHSQII